MTEFFNENMFSAEDFIIAGVLALFFTWLILNVTKFFNAVMKRPTEFLYQAKDINKIIQRCYTLFPNETVNFRGKTFKRGMSVRVTTVSKKTFEGKLIGLNNENIFCVLTKTFIAADILDNVTEIINISDIDII